MTERSNFKAKSTPTVLYQLLENQIIPLYYAKPDGKTAPRLAAIDARIDSQRHARFSILTGWSRNTPSVFTFRPRIPTKISLTTMAASPRRN